jgi:hypothetical protein
MASVYKRIKKAVRARYGHAKRAPKRKHGWKSDWDVDDAPESFSTHGSGR